MNRILSQVSNVINNEADVAQIKGKITKPYHTQGARLVHGGKRLGSKGFFIEPTIFADCTEDMTIIKEEIFGPVCMYVCMSVYTH